MLMRDDDLQRIPRKRDDDYSETALALRRTFLSELSGQTLEGITQFAGDPHQVEGNIEQMIGAAHVPLGVAGPLRINGEEAVGDFYVPLATTEGTLVASYNRGMRVISLSGGCQCTIVEDRMQRAPVFVFKSAAAGRDFIQWVLLHAAEIATEAESTTSHGRLVEVEPYQSNKFAFLRFNFATGDAAGQNMVSKATLAACEWIRVNYNQHPIEHFYLESNFATDKKSSQINMLRTRGKRVTAEVEIDREVLSRYTRVTPEKICYHNQVANIGTLLAGAHNNGLHSANGVTALFIATGQDVANVAESASGFLHCETTPEGDLYASITIPSLIVATHGGGTGLPTPQECLGILGCKGAGKARKFAEVVAATVLAGEISLAAAISASDWVSSHEQYGRNR